jgi:Tfp pilus assembly protein PilF
MDALREIDAQHFSRELRGRTESGSQFVFLLGAGASRSSGIPTGGELVREWLIRFWSEAKGATPREAEENFSEVADWARDVYMPALVETNLGASYGQAIESFFPTEALRANEIHRLCTRAEPGFAYAFLAKLIESGIPEGSSGPGAFPAVLTTNFDDLVSVAMTWWSERRPRVVTDAALGHHIDLHGPDPLIVHLHGAYQLKPLNTSSETSGFRPPMVSRLQSILAGKGLIFVGYGGHDLSVCKLLTDLPPTHCSHGVYWVASEMPEPEAELGEWLMRENATFVDCPDFDALAYSLHQSYEINAPNARRFERVLGGVNSLLQKYADSRKGGAGVLAAGDQEPSDGVGDAKSDWASVFDALLAISAANDRDEKERIFQEALALPAYANDARLLTSYAIFKTVEEGDFEEARRLFSRAVELEPDNPSSLANYANFLINRKGDYELAESLASDALELDPDYPTAIIVLARLQSEVHGDARKARQLFDRAIELEPRNGIVAASFADFCSSQGDFDEAEKFYEIALSLEPEEVPVLVNYAGFLTAIRNDLVRAKPLLEKALAKSPDNPVVLANYATYFWQADGEGEEAEAMFEKAIEARPDSPDSHANFSDFLLIARGDSAGALKHLEAAISLRPDDADLLGSLARIHFAMGDDAEGVKYCNEVIRTAIRPKHDRVLAEVHVYLLACGPEDQEDEHRAALEQLVEIDGVRSAGWQFGPVLKRSRELGRATLEEAQMWASRISGGDADRE